MKKKKCCNLLQFHHQRRVVTSLRQPDGDNDVTDDVFAVVVPGQLPRWTRASSDGSVVAFYTFTSEFVIILPILKSFFAYAVYPMGRRKNYVLDLSARLCVRARMPKLRHFPAGFLLTYI